jgi:S-adenosylmethionine decarboxylase
VSAVLFSDPSRPVGRHLIAELTQVEPRLLADPEAIRALLVSAAQASGATVLQANLHHFGEGMGVTGVVLLAESHMSIHTWPEHGYAALDIFVCGECQPLRALEAVVAAFGNCAYQEKVIARGLSLDAAL